MYLKTFILFTFLIIQILSITFTLKAGTQFCLKVQGGSKFDIEYGISGINPQLVKFSIKQNQKQILSKSDVSQASFGTQIPQGKASLCWLTGDSQDKKVTVQFHQSSDQYYTVIDKKDINIVKQSLIKSLKDLSQISKNQQFHMERDHVHKYVLEQSQRRIKWAGIIKIAFLLTSALLQLWIMKGFFKNSNPYQPVNI